MTYKLTYDVAGRNESVERYADTEIALARELLKMEMEDGFLCHNVKIEDVDCPEDFPRNTPLKPQLETIARYAKTLNQAIHINK